MLMKTAGGPYISGIFKRVFPYLMVILFSLPGPAPGQNPPYINYSEQNGLSTSVVYGLFQDHEDNIWFCTNTGAVKCNGRQLINYEKKDGLSSNEVFKIYEDSRHRLWFMTSSGRLSYYKDKKIYNEKDHPVFKEIGIRSYISDIREDEKNNIWIVPNNGDVYSLSPDLSSFTRHPAGLQNGIFVQHKGKSYVTNREGIISLEDHKFFMQSLSRNLVSLLPRHCFTGNRVFTGRNRRVEEYDLESRTALVREFPDMPDVFNAVLVIDSSFYICSPKGLSIYDLKTFRKKGHYFDSENVSHVLKDQEGSLWVSTLNHGVKYISNSQVRFMRSSDYFGGNKILKLNGIGEHIIIGQSNSKATYYKHGLLRSINSPNESKGEGLTYLIKPNVPDTSFLIASQAGVTLFPVYGKPTYFGNMTILAYEVYDKDSVYISTPSIIGKFSKKIHPSLFGYQNNPWAIDTERADALYYNRDDSILYACTRQGLVLYRNRTKFENKYPELNGLALTDIEKTIQGMLIITTYGDGFFMIYKGSVINIKEDKGLSNNMCTSVFVQNDSTVWITSYNGLNRIRYTIEKSVPRYKVMNFYRNDGLPSNYINDMYNYRDSIWLATNVGLAIFNENDLTRYSYTPRIAIDAILANGVNLPWHHGKSIILERSTNSVAIEFNCNTFKNAGSVVYKYKLSGLNSSWMETRNNQVDFNGLGPGGYLFEVYAISLNGNWQSDVAQISFTIKQALWEKNWFRVLSLLIFMALVLWAIIYQFRKVKKEFAVQQKMMNYEKELLELEQQALRLQMNPHFIFNALNSIQHAILTGKQDAAYHHLELFSSLIRGILENSKHKFITLEDEIGILRIYIQIEATRFEGDFNYEVIIDPEIDTSCIMIPPMLIQPFVENSIWHGLMPKTSGEKKLILSFASAGDEIICKVEDNGIGRREAALRKGKKQGSSLGTILTMNRLANINLLEKKQYTIDITDKENDGGTIVTIRIPV